ncbi:transglycosylase domain-containing protein [Dictyobacter arantiisoli]|uniref:Penicillin-binding protein 1A n=1 Tax=Dictyobacter arantiisoli TaxID=2014874 RepID=A0A5A5TDF9_9CHLR|nr:transglycosylase domain-containing protein [Dictyobacter arantiisoli]GCF09245.1 penicillin-binding protein 1A [Dictyobacter arantiisoli]
MPMDDIYKHEQDSVLLPSERGGHDNVSIQDQAHDIEKVVQPQAAVTELSYLRRLRTHAKTLQKRRRINRVFMRKHRHERLYVVFMPRLTFIGLVLMALCVSLSSGLGGAAVAFYVSQLPLLDGIAQHSLFQTTHIYDRTGKLLYELYDHATDARSNAVAGRRTYVTFSDIPNSLVNATIAAEDHTFWTNSGVDYYGITRAMVANVKSHNVTQGGSTITQQVIKNQLFLNQDRTLQIKGEEALLATALTQRYSKGQIMEMYLNTVFYGDTNFGIEAAAQDYFGLQPKCARSGRCTPAVEEMTLGESTLLAGLPQSPTAYMPFYNKRAALERQQHILDNMLLLHMITPAQSKAAHQEMVNFKFKRLPMVKNAPHFVDYLVDQVLIPLFGARNLVDGGYSIYTTLDLDLERQVEKITASRINGNAVDAYGYTNLKTAHNLNNAAVVVTDPTTGQLLAMNGSVNYNDTSNDPRVQGQFNSAADALRQPGSSFKPFVYATAFEMGWYPAMIIPDIRTYFPDGVTPYGPLDYDRHFRGAYNMTIRRAIANSFNLPAIQALEFAGIPNVMNTSARFGLTNVAHTPKSQQGASMALGSSVESLLNMTNAYAVFANKGVRMPQVTILQINDNLGHPIYKFDPQRVQGVRVISEEVAFLMSSILSDNPARYEEFGPGNPLELDRPAAAKTGTTDSFVDNWTLGYTPHLAVGVWAGNSDNTPMENVIGITGAGPIWHDVMTWANKHYHFPSDGFPSPPDVHKDIVSAYTGLLPHLTEPTVSDWFIDGTQPTIEGPYYAPPIIAVNPNPDVGNGDKKNPNEKNSQNQDNTQNQGQDNTQNQDNNQSQDQNNP